MLDKITIEDVLKTLEHYVKGGGRYSTAYEQAETKSQEGPVADSVDKKPSIEDGLFAIAAAVNKLASAITSRPAYYYGGGGGNPSTYYGGSSGRGGAGGGGSQGKADG